VGLFDFLKTPQSRDHPVLGALRHGEGKWRGVIELDGARIPVFIPGSRSGPDPAALRSAEQSAAWWSQTRPDVARELFEHFDAGREAEIPGLPDIADASGVWAHARLTSVEVGPYGSNEEVRVAIHTAWDDEHTLGALIRNGDFVDLNGSILEPR
jgi:hypothetical protein